MSGANTDLSRCVASSGCEEAVLCYLNLCACSNTSCHHCKNADRDAFFSAVEALYRTDMREGRMRYGEKFINGQSLSRKHAAAMDVDGCTPWHNGYVFLTAHAGECE